MPFFRKSGLFESNRVLTVPIRDLEPNPNQPRRNFAPEALHELAASIAEHGILQPLSVRRTGAGLELVSGERRMRAAKLAGLEAVPCIVVTVDDAESSLLALVENLQRRDLDFVEEALALSKLIRTFDLSQEEAARRIGKSQSAVANKLRLLKLSPDALTLLRSAGCTERHARALLALPDEAAQLDAARHVIANGLTVAATERYVEDRLTGTPPGKKKRKPTVLLRDVRLFLNTIDRSVSLMKTAGIPAKCNRSDTDSEILLTIRIPKTAS